MIASRFRSIALLCVMVVALLACKGSKPNCKASLTWEGKTFEGTGKGDPEAKESVCLGWCAHHDPEIDSKYTAWKSTPKGQASKDSRFGDIYSWMPGGKAMLLACKERCQRHINSDPSAVKVSCP